MILVPTQNIERKTVDISNSRFPPSLSLGLLTGIAGLQKKWNPNKKACCVPMSTSPDISHRGAYDNPTCECEEGLSLSSLEVRLRVLASTSMSSARQRIGILVPAISICSARVA